jgi:RNA polymerase sigma factor (sigma-70 family)
MRPLETTLGGSREAFPETVWSTLLGSSGPDTPQRREALNDLVQIYWRPVYKYIRTAGRASIEDAKDLTQEFFSYLLEGGILARYDREKARFRSYLKGVLSNFLSVERRDAARLKRGGGQAPVALDVAALETPGFLAERERATPDEIFDRQWAAEIIAESLAELRRQLDAEGRRLYLTVYERYHELGATPAGSPTYASLGRELGLSEQQIKDHLAVARERLERIVRDRLARRVASPREVTEEINALLFG